MEECLRFNILEISSQQCAKQVVRLITEAHADIHLDPVRIPIPGGGGSVCLSIFKDGSQVFLRIFILIFSPILEYTRPILLYFLDKEYN